MKTSNPLLKLLVGWSVIVLWIVLAIWAGIRYETVYLAYLGTTAAGDPDHITRYFAIGVLCCPAIVMSWHVRGWQDG